MKKMSLYYYNIKNIKGLSIKSIALRDCSYNICNTEVFLSAGRDYGDVKTSLLRRKHQVFNLIDICMNDGFTTLIGSKTFKSSADFD